MCTLSEKEKIEALEKKLYKVYLIKDNILVCTFFGLWCIVVLNDQFEIIKKYWSEKEKVLKCFSNFIKKDKLDLTILGIKKNKIDFKPFRMDLDIRNCWYD